DIMQGKWKAAMDKMGQATETSWTKITLNVLEGLGGLIETLLKALGQPIVDYMDQITFAAVDGFKGLFTMLGGLATGAGQVLSGNFAGAAETLSTTWDATMNYMRSATHHVMVGLVGDAEEAVKPLPVIMQESILAGLPGATKAGGAVGTAAGNSFVTNFLSQAAKAPTFLGALGQKPAPTPMAGGAYDPAKDPIAQGAKKQQEAYEKWVREHP